MRLYYAVVILAIFCISGILYGGEVYVDHSLDAVKMNPKLLDPAQYKVHYGHGVPNSSSKKASASYYTNQYYSSAAARYTAHLKADPGNKNTLYNLSCSYSMMNQPKKASYYLKLAFQNGFTNLRHVMKSKKFANVKDDPVFKATVDSLLAEKANLGKIKPKRAAQVRINYFD